MPLNAGNRTVAATVLNELRTSRSPVIVTGYSSLAFFMLSISAGNLFTSVVNFFIENPDSTSRLAGADYFLFFTALMLVTAILFTLVTRFYRGERHIHAAVAARG